MVLKVQLLDELLEELHKLIVRQKKKKKICSFLKIIYVTSLKDNYFAYLGDM